MVVALFIQSGEKFTFQNFKTTLIKFMKFKNEICINTFCTSLVQRFDVSKTEQSSKFEFRRTKLEFQSTISK